MSIYLFVYFYFECKNFERFLDFAEEKPGFRISFGENLLLFLSAFSRGTPRGAAVGACRGASIWRPPRPAVTSIRLMRDHHPTKREMRRHRPAETGQTRVAADDAPWLQPLARSVQPQRARTSPELSLGARYALHRRTIAVRDRLSAGLSRPGVTDGARRFRRPRHRSGQPGPCSARRRG